MTDSASVPAGRWEKGRNDFASRAKKDTRLDCQNDEGGGRVLSKGLRKGGKNDDSFGFEGLLRFGTGVDNANRSQ